jgi:hypothetical protein
MFYLRRYIKEAGRMVKEKIQELRGRSAQRTPAGYFEPLGDFGGDEL